MYTECVNSRMPRKRQVQTRVASDTKEKLEEYRENQNLSQADALRRLIRDGLDHTEPERDDKADDEADIMQTVQIIGGAVIGIAAIGIMLSELDATVAATGGLAFVGAVVGGAVGTTGDGR